MQILKLSLRDFFSKQGLSFTFLPFISAFVFLVFSLVFFYDDLYAYIYSFIANPELSFLAWLYSFSFMQVLNKIFAFLISLLLFNILALALALVILAFLTPAVLRLVNSRHYSYETKDGVSAFKAFFSLVFIFLKFALLFVLALFFIFVPFLGIFLLHLSFYYLFHKSLLLDLSSSMLSSQDFSNFNKSTPFIFYFSTLCFYLLSLLPILGLFLQVFFLIFLAHLLYQKILALSPKE